MFVITIDCKIINYCNDIFIVISYLFEISIVIYCKIIGIKLLQWFLQFKLLQKNFDYFNLSYCKKKKILNSI